MPGEWEDEERVDTGLASVLHEVDGEEEDLFFRLPSESVFVKEIASRETESILIKFNNDF